MTAVGVDKNKRPLKIPPEFIQYADQHGLFDLFQDMVSYLLVNRSGDPLQDMLRFLKQPRVMSVLMLGPPASGKTSVAHLFAEKTKSVHIRARELVKKEILSNSEQGNEAKTALDKGLPVPAHICVSLIKSRIEMEDCRKNGWILDEFPSTRPEALALQQAGVLAGRVIVLDAGDAVLLERCHGRRIDPKTNLVYHTVFNPPPSAVQVVADPQDQDGASSARLAAYRKDTAAFLAAFHNAYSAINVDRPLDDVFSHLWMGVCTPARSSGPLIPRIVLAGALGSGKTTMAKLLQTKYGAVHISMDVLLAQVAGTPTKLGESIKTYLDQKMAVPDDLQIGALQQRLTHADCGLHGWVLDGFPASLHQAELLAKAGFQPNRVFFLNVPESTILERLTHRRIDPVTGVVYHLLYAPPPTSTVLARLVDAKNVDASLIKESLADYQQQVRDLGVFYTTAHHLNADQEPSNVLECLESLLVQPTKLTP